MAGLVPGHPRDQRRHCQNGKKAWITGSSPVMTTITRVGASTLQPISMNRTAVWRVPAIHIFCLVPGTYRPERMRGCPRIKSGHDDSLKHVFASKHWPNDGYMIAQIINFKMLIIAK
jgi:hypothetical protein